MGNYPSIEPSIERIRVKNINFDYVLYHNHREDGPAYSEPSNGLFKYLRNGELHNLEGPALIKCEVQQFKFFCEKHDILRDFPVYSKCKEWYFIAGQEIEKEDFQDAVMKYKRVTEN